MVRPDFQKRYPLTLIIAAVLAASPAMADKPSWAGGGKRDNREQHERHDYRAEDRKDYELNDLPPTVVMNIGYPPPGYRFVQVASDILMIAIGTGIVMDAIYDLGGRRW